MAIDSREKRQSAFSLAVPSLTPGVEPSSIDQAERQAAGWVYSGVLATNTSGVETVQSIRGTQVWTRTLRIR